MSRHSDPNQLSLFGPGLDVVPAVKRAMHQAAKASPLSREQICDKMNELASNHGVRLNGGNTQRLSTATLEKWLNPYAEHYPSVRALVVFCRVVDDLRPIQALCAPLGAQLVDERQAKLLERAEIEAQIKALQKKKKHIEAEL
ncbi:hypothetical protein [Desulfohalovibrio reitneri]|uniref:hypothetical protein n=1 Tax=Desulfohalovibrio reitneri TaxID=1307759 RepID=UPI000689491D|nr:hypothetical protein [Desulfohalovibrio reitneri]